MTQRLSTSALAFALSACAAVTASAQTPDLVFTMKVPEQTRSEAGLQASAVVEERGLALWGGSASDFGVAVALSRPGWALRSITSMTALPMGSDLRPVFQQVEIIRPVFLNRSISIAGGGGVREEWDGTRVLIGRVLAGSNVAGGRLQGSLVVERAMASPVRADAADVVTSLGWSRPIEHRVSVGIEGIGQDLEGLWTPAEADGGARLLVGPSVHAQSTRARWAASLTAGPVFHTSSTVSSSRIPAATYSVNAHDFGLFASVIWVPSWRR